MLIFPHGIHVDREGNVWVTDGQDNAPQPARGAGGGGGRRRWRRSGSGRRSGRRRRGRLVAAGGQRAADAGQRRRRLLRAATMGHQVFKFSPEGKLLLTIGKRGRRDRPDRTAAGSRTT